MSAEALTWLLNLIKQVLNNKTNRQHKERLQNKVNNAAQTFLVKNALLQARNHHVPNIIDKGKVRRSTKSKILGKALMSSYEDLERARAEHVTKEATKEAKKVASAAPEADAEPKAKVARMNEAQVAEADVPEPWRAPVARMW